jgi:hypothetical protein
MTGIATRSIGDHRAFDLVVCLRETVLHRVAPWPVLHRGPCCTVAGIERWPTMVNSRGDEAMKEVESLREQVGSVERKLDTLSTSVDARFDTVDARFAQVDVAFLEQRQYTEFAFDRLRTEMQDGFERLERKLDQFIDVQMRTNILAERRLTLLESRLP